MNVIALYGSNVGRKATMAISGLTVVGWLFAHMLGNVAIYAGRDSYNAYAAILADRPPILWGQRFVLTAALLIHIHAAVTLWARSERARPTPYRVEKSVATDYASKSMRWGGVTLLAFTVYHILQTTVGVTGHLGYEYVQRDVYNNTVLGFMNPWVSGFYLISMAALSLHRYHGVWSITQSLGLDAPHYAARRARHHDARDRDRVQRRAARRAPSDSGSGRQGARMIVGGCGQILAVHARAAG